MTRAPTVVMTKPGRAGSPAAWARDRAAALAPATSGSAGRRITQVDDEGGECHLARQHGRTIVSSVPPGELRLHRCPSSVESVGCSTLERRRTHPSRRVAVVTAGVASLVDGDGPAGASSGRRAGAARQDVSVPALRAAAHACRTLRPPPTAPRRAGAGAAGARRRRLGERRIVPAAVGRARAAVRRGRPLAVGHGHRSPHLVPRLDDGRARPRDRTRRGGVATLPRRGRRRASSPC